MLTIADVMGALVDRAYRKGLPAAEAYARIVAMAEAGKLDGALVRAFADVVKAMNAYTDGHRMIVGIRCANFSCL